MMTRTYDSKSTYVNKLSEILEARYDVKKLEYHKDNKGKEYMFMYLVTGDVKYFDISGKSNADIFHIVAQIECGIVPKEFICDTERRLDVGKLFLSAE